MPNFQRIPLDGAALDTDCSTAHKRGWIHAQVIRRAKGVRAHAVTDLRPQGDSADGVFLLPEGTAVGDVVSVRVYRRNALGAMRTDGRLSLLIAGFDLGGAVYLADQHEEDHFVSARDALDHSDAARDFCRDRGLRARLDLDVDMENPDATNEEAPAHV